MNRGFVYLWRQLKDNPIIKKPGLIQLFVWILLEVNHKDKRFIFNGNEVLVKKGQSIFGRKQISKDLGVDEGTIYKRIQTLSRLGIISVKSNNKFSIISLLKYEDFQNKNYNGNNKVTTKEQQSNTTNNDNNFNNDNNSIREESSPSIVINNVNNSVSVYPTIDECQQLWLQKGWVGGKLEAEKFFYYYDAKGWLVNKNKMKNWKSAAAGWNLRSKSFAQNGKTNEQPIYKPIPKCPECHYNLTDGGICYTPECSKHGQKVNLLADIMNGIHKVEV